MSTEAAKPAETTATTPPTQPETKAPETKTQATEDTAMKTAETAPAKPAETAPEKRKTPEGDDEENVSEGVKKLTRLVEEHSDVKELLHQLSEKNKTNEKIAEVYRKQAAKQFAEGQCLALGLTKGTPEFERRFGEQIQFASQHPEVLNPLMDQIIASQRELLNLSTSAAPPAPPTKTAPPPEKKTATPPPAEKKPKKESFDFVKSLTNRTRENMLTQELIGTSSSSSSAAESTADQKAPRSSTSATESWTRVNTSQPALPPTMGPFLNEMMKDRTASQMLARSQQMVTAKAGSEHAERNEIMSSIVERFQRWQPRDKSLDGVCPDGFSTAMPIIGEARRWPESALRV